MSKKRMEGDPKKNSSLDIMQLKYVLQPLE